MKHLSNNNFLEDNKQKIKILERKKKIILGLTELKGRPQKRKRKKNVTNTFVTHRI